MSEGRDRPKGTQEGAEDVADRVRDELLITLRELDRRRHGAFDLRSQLSGHRQQLLSVGGLLIGGAGLLIGALAWRAHVRHSPARLRRRRVESLRRAWSHPDRVAVPERERSVLAQVLNKVVLAFAVGAGTRLAKVTVLRLIPVEPVRTPVRVQPSESLH